MNIEEPEESKDGNQDNPEKELHLSFTSRPDTNSHGYDFQEEVKQLPLKMNLAYFSQQQQARILHIIYNN